MKATLEFDLPEDLEDFEYAKKGVIYSIVLSEIDNYLRSQIKYNESLTDEQTDTYRKVRTKLAEIANNHEIDY